VLHDTVADVYLVSNINGNPLERDGNGFISRVSPDGQVLERAWIAGGSGGVTLNAPKGLAIEGGTLYVADIDCIRLFDRETGAHKKDVCLKSATFLNDVASSPDGSVFFTDSGLQAGADGLALSGTDAVYRLIDDDRVVAVKKEPALGSPNGLTVGSRGILVVTFGSGEVYRLDAEGNRTNMMPPSQRQLDGIELLPDGGFVMSSWGDSAVYRIGADGHVTKAVEHLDAPADIGYDATRNRVLIPLFNTGVVVIHPLG
jgi:streptogramin lyase